MGELGNLLDKVVKASRTKEVKEALYAYRTMVGLDTTMRNKYNERLEPGYSNWEDGYFKGTMRSFEEDTRPLVYQMIENQRERVIEIMGLSDVAKRDDMSDIFYHYGKGKFSYESFIQLLTNEVWEYYYSKKEAPVSIQVLKKFQNSFLISFDTTN